MICAENGPNRARAEYQAEKGQYTPEGRAKQGAGVAARLGDGNLWFDLPILTFLRIILYPVWFDRFIALQRFPGTLRGFGLAVPTIPRRTAQVASVAERVTDIVADQLGVDKEKITPETSFVNDLGADSLDTVELVMELEEEFDINIPDDAAEKIQTVGQAIKFIEEAQNA